ncbi:MAG TPA: nuclear transport factor 2 family protein [Blastocatellia bacterium]|nr:nuclear transport factor 2 family protein [Blastocatellia bacterium]
MAQSINDGEIQTKEYAKDLLDEQAEKPFDSPDKVEHFFDIWGLASRNYDDAALDRLVNDNYEFVSPDGKSFGKEQMIGSVRGGHPDFTSFESSEWEVLTLAENVALKRSVIDVEGILGGRNISGKYRLSNLFIRDEKGWRLSNCQLTAVNDNKCQ